MIYKQQAWAIWITKEGRGILCCSSIAANTEGLPLSLLYQHTWIRPLEELGKSAKRKTCNFEDKESYRWHEGMTEVNNLLGNTVHKIHIADREADVYELFFQALHLADLEKQIELSISSLPEKCQKAFRMSRMQHMTSEEIARAMGISHRTVENYISQALKHLKVSLGGIGVMLVLMYAVG